MEHQSVLVSKSNRCLLIGTLLRWNGFLVVPSLTTVLGQSGCSHGYPGSWWTVPSLQSHWVYRGLPQHWSVLTFAKHKAEHIFRNNWHSSEIAGGLINLWYCLLPSDKLQATNNAKNNNLTMNLDTISYFILPSFREL